jgi:hypothetical protein
LSNGERHPTEPHRRRKPRDRRALRFDSPSILIGLEPDGDRVLCWHIFADSPEERARAYAFWERVLAATEVACR